MAICKKCVFLNMGNICGKYKTQIANPMEQVDCEKFAAIKSNGNFGRKSKPKGLEIRDKKRAKNNAKMRKIKDSQIGVCQFVWFRYMLFRQNHGWTVPYKEVANVGLQIENKIYMNDGHYKFVNSKHLHIEKVYEVPPQMASDSLLDLYDKFWGNKTE